MQRVGGHEKVDAELTLDRCVLREGGIALGPRPVGTETRT